MTKQMLYKLRHIATELNGQHKAGEEVTHTKYDEDRWYTTKEVVEAYKEYIKDQESFAEHGMDGRYVLKITDTKVGNLCQHCGGDVTEDGGIF